MCFNIRYQRLVSRTDHVWSTMGHIVGQRPRILNINILCL